MFQVFLSFLLSFLLLSSNLLSQARVHRHCAYENNKACKDEWVCILPHYTMYSICDSLTYFMLTWGVNSYSDSCCCRNGSIDDGDEGATTMTTPVR